MFELEVRIRIFRLVLVIVVILFNDVFSFGFRSVADGTASDSHKTAQSGEKQFDYFFLLVVFLLLEDPVVIRENPDVGVVRTL